MSNLLLINDSDLDSVVGGIEVLSVTPGHTFLRPAGFTDVALSNGIPKGLFVSPHLGDGDPVKCIILP